jgi:hypothetical protein
MCTVIKVIFKVAYCYKSTSDICYKEGNSLLFAICSTHPEMLGVVLNEIDAELMQIGKRALNLCSELPFNKWLPYIILTKDMVFIQKCLLMTPTNSILFKVATNLIDSLDFNQNTLDTSKACINKHPHIFEQVQQNGLIEMAHIFKAKLTVILFELHSRLTIYNYYGRQMAGNTDGVNIQMFGDLIQNAENMKNVCSKEELGMHYSKLAKDKRFELAYWIWVTLYRMNQFFQVNFCFAFVN